MKDYVITLGYPKKMTYGHTYGNAFVWAAMALTQTQPGKPSFFRASEIRANKTSQNSRLIFVNSSPSSMQARMASYQMAFRMQTEVHGVLSLEHESWKTRQLYGVDDPPPPALAVDVFWHASWSKRAYALCRAILATGTVMTTFIGRTGI